MPDAPSPPVQAPWTAVIRSLTRTAYSGSYGIAYAINLTPDPATGLVEPAWTETAFLQALKTGRHNSTNNPRALATPMLNVSIRVSNLSDDDLKAMFAYLRSIPPIRNHVPDLASPIPDGGTQADGGTPTDGGP
jgi:hypothetical protein